MKRVEVILTQAIESDFMVYYTAACKSLGVKPKMTQIPGVMGQGNTSPKMGDPVWPQLNTMFIIFCDEKTVDAISKIMAQLHKEYAGEGAAAFVSDAGELI